MSLTVKQRSDTVEFDFVANINSLGVCDREVDIEKGNRYRILCFGDSWTFGWGVEIEKLGRENSNNFFMKKDLII